MKPSVILVLCGFAFSQPNLLEMTAADPPEMKRAPVSGGELEYEIRGNGEPVLLIHGAHIAASYLPLMGETALERYRLIRYHRRGFANSTKHVGPFTVEQQARDALALLNHLGTDRAHIVGHSGGGVISLQLAIDAPEAVHSLTLLEPALGGMVPSGAELRQSIGKASQLYQEGDPAGAVDVFMRAIVGLNWETELSRTISGGPEQAKRDARTFFEIELPAHAEWQFDAEKAQEISQPILHIFGRESPVAFHEIQGLLDSLFPGQVEGHHVIEGAGHGLHQMGGRHSRKVAELIAAFLREHPMDQ